MVNGKIFYFLFEGKYFDLKLTEKKVAVFRLHFGLFVQFGLRKIGQKYFHRKGFSFTFPKSGVSLLCD